MIGRGTRIHKRLRDNAQTRVDNVRLVNVEDKVGILDQIHPETQWQRIALPRVHDLRIGDAMLNGLVVQEVEHVLDGEW